MDSRARFEAACKQLGFSGYIEPLYDLWQACEASRDFVVELPDPTKIEKGDGHYAIGFADGENVMRIASIAAIEKAGGRVK